jgi:hypothetical protein
MLRLFRTRSGRLTTRGEAATIRGDAFRPSARGRARSGAVRREPRDLETKFRGQAEGILSASEAEKLLSLSWEVATLKDAAEIAKASVPA